MASLPRIITVDPSGNLARFVRAATDLLDRPVILSDIPSGAGALEEVKQVGCNLLFSSWYVDGEINGPLLAMQTKQASEKTGVVVFSDGDGPSKLDPEEEAESPFVFLSRPVKIDQFLRVLIAGLDGQDIKEAMKAPASVGLPIDFGPVPTVDVGLAKGFVDDLLRDLGATAIFLTTREGEVLLECGAAGYLDREKLTFALMPTFAANMDVKEIVGGQARVLQFYDGDEFDIFVLSVGLHHFLCVLFDGQGGSRQLGAVKNYGGRAAEDLAATIGPAAWAVMPKQREATPRKKRTEETPVVEEDAPLVIGRFGGDETPVEEEIILEPAVPLLEAIPDDQFNVDDIFNQQNIDESAFDDLFSEENLESLVAKSSSGDKLDLEEAERLGIIGD